MANNNTSAQQSGNAVIIVLVLLAVVTIGALAFVSGKLADKTATADAAKQTEITATDELLESDDVAASEEIETGAPITVPVPKAPKEIRPGNPVVATINGEDVTRMQVMQQLQALPEQARQLPQEQLFELGQDQIVNQIVIDQQIADVNLDDDPLVKEQLAAAKAQIVKAVFVQREVEKALTAEREQAAYQEYVDNFVSQPEANAQHILVEDEALATDLIAQLNDGASFAELAKEYSKDTTADNGGELGFFLKSDVVPAFGEFVFSSEAGAISQTPVQTQFGYHVIKTGEIRDRQPVSFEEAKPSIDAQLGQIVLQETLAKWREDADVTLFDINGDDPNAPEAVAPTSGDEAPESVEAVEAVEEVPAQEPAQ